MGFGREVGEQAKDVIKFVIPNWSDFVSVAEKKNGLFGPQPAEPSVRFFVRYHDCAVNLLREAMAQKKELQEREASHLSSTAASTPAIAPATSPPTNGHVPATKDEVEALLAEFYADSGQAK